MSNRKNSEFRIHNSQLKDFSPQIYKSYIAIMKLASVLLVILFIQCKPLTISRKSKPPKAEKKEIALQKEIAELEKKVDKKQKKNDVTEEKAKKPEEILQELEKEMLEKEQASKFLSDKYYELGKELYKSRELENAKSALIKSLEHNPANAQAKTLLQDIKLELGEVTSGDIGNIARTETQRIFAQIQGARFEVTKLYQDAIDDFKEKKYQDAKLKFTKVIETLKLFPYELKLQDVEKKSKEYLKQIDKEIKREKFIESKKLQEKAQEEAKNIEEKEKAYTKKQLQQLIKEALYHLKAKNFTKSKELVKQAQEIAPFNRKIQQLAAKIDEAEFIHKNKVLEAVQEEEEAKRKIMEESKTIIPPEEFNFPSKEIWAEIKKRKPDVPIIQSKEETIFEREVETNLRKLSVEAYSISNLADVINPLRIQADEQGIKINFNYMGKNSLEEVKVPEKIAPYPFAGGTGEDFIRELKKVFPNLIIKIVAGGVVFLDKTYEIVKEEFVTKLYNVRDIIEPINTLSKTPRIPGVGLQEDFAVEAMPGIKSETLVKLICKDIKEFISTVDTADQGNSVNCDEPDRFKEFINQDSAQNLGVISVTAPEEAHLIVREILKNIRHFSSIMISVETRFLLVTEDFIQDIGIDMRGLNADDFDNAVLLSSFPNPPFSFFSRDVAKIVPTTAIGQLPNPPLIKNQPSAGIFRQSHDLRGRLENIMADDQVVRTLFRNILEPAGGFTAQYTLLGNTQIRAILRAVERDRRIKTLLGQNIVAHNGERVYFRNINKLKYVKSLQDSGSLPGQPLLTPETADIVDGVFLDVRPVVDNDRKYVRLELEPQVVSLIPPPPDIKKIEFVAATTTTFGGGTQPPQGGEIRRFIETPEREFQELKTSIVVPDGGTVLIGGLTGRVEGTARQEVPVLSQIPIIGSLFSRKIKGYQRRILVILVTAKIIVPEEKE